MFTNFLKISFIFIIWIFEKIINEFTNEFIELNLSLSFLNFSHFAKVLSNFLNLSHFHEYLIAIVILEMNSLMNSFESPHNSPVNYS